MSKISKLANQYVAELSKVGVKSPNQRIAQKLGDLPIPDFGKFEDVIEQSYEPGIGSRLLDILSRPLYTVANLSKATAENINVLQGDEGAEVRNPFEAAWKGFTGEEKTTFSDVIREDLRGKTLGETPLSEVKPFGILKTGDIKSIVDPNSPGGSVEDWIAGIGGLGLDLTLDPVNLVAGGATKIYQAIKGAKKVARSAQEAEEPLRSVTGVSAVDKYWKEIPEEEVAKAFPQEQVAPDIAPTPQVNTGADAVVEAAQQPVVPHLNIPRKTAEPEILDNIKMGGTLGHLTTGAAARIRVAEKARTKPPKYISEINPDDYILSIHLAQEGNFVNARQLAQVQNIPYKTALRHIQLMEKDGLISTAQETAQRRGLEPKANVAHSSRSIKHDAINAKKDANGVVDPNQLIIGQKPVTDLTRASDMYDQVMPELRQHFEEAAAQGSKPQVVSRDGARYTLNTANILDSLPREIVENYNFGGIGKKGLANLYPSQWHAGAAEALRMAELGADPSASVSAIAQAMRDSLRGNASRINIINESESVERAAEALHANSDALAAKVAENIRRYSLKDHADATAIASTKLQNTDAALKDGSLSDAIDSVVNVGSDINKAAKEIGATDDAAISAIQQVAPEVAKLADNVDITAARNANAAANVRRTQGFSPQADSKILQRNGKFYALVERNADEIAREAGLPTLTLGEKTAFTLNTFLEKLMHPLRNAFQYGYHTGGGADVLRVHTARAENEGHFFRQVVKQISKKHDKDSINAAWTAWRRGSSPTDPKVAEAFRDIRGLIDHTVENGLRGRLFRNGAPLDAVNQALKESGVKFQFKKPAKAEDSALVPDQVRDWDITDPLSELERINKAALLVETRQTVGASVSRFGSAQPKPGYVKLRAGELSTLGKYIDTGLFYPRELGEYAQQLDILAGSSMTFRGQKGGIAWFANNIIDPVMQIWKPFMTIVRPGHLARNLWSDLIMASFNGVMSVRPYRIAARTLKASGEFTREGLGVQGIQKLSSAEPIVAGSDVAFHYRGKPVSYQGLYKMAHDEGLLLNWHTTEDIQETASKFTDTLMKNRYVQTMGKANEMEGQFIRIAHFQHLLEKGVDIAEAGKQVRKFHPDVRGLTPFEQKYMRRVFPFYSWFRQALPVVLTTMLQKPGRVTNLFKTEYAVAQAMGINPDSMVDPFPDDKLYPSFVRDNIVGPIAGDWGVNLGTPQEGILGDTLNGSPARNIAGMLNPIFKAPYEITSRTNLGTGANIADMSDYIDSQLPIINQVSNISGYSVTGLGANQRAVEKGEKDHFFNAQMVNFLTGLGLMDYGKPSYKVIAGKERQ